MSTSTVLDEIIVGVREDLTQRMEQVPLERVKELALAAEPGTRLRRYTVMVRRYVLFLR